METIAYLKNFLNQDKDRKKTRKYLLDLLIATNFSPKAIKNLAEKINKTYGPEGLLKFVQDLGWSMKYFSLKCKRESHGLRSRLDRVINLYFLLYHALLLSRHTSSVREFLQGLARLFFHFPEFKIVWTRMEGADLVLPEEASEIRTLFPQDRLDDWDWMCEPKILKTESLNERLLPFAKRFGIKRWILLPLNLRGWLSGMILLGTSRSKFSDWEKMLILEDLHEQINASLEFIREKRIEENHLFDPLTGLPTEGYFLVLAEQLLKEAEERGQRFVMLSIGVDRLVHVNQAFGFRTGDELIKILAERLKRFVGDTGEICRGKSETFYVLVPEPPKLSEYLDELRRSMSGPVKLGKITLEVTISMGVARFPSDATAPGTLMREARTALHEAKRLGGNRTAFFSEDLHQKARTFLTLLPRLRRALRNGEFVVYCQPRIDLKESRICGGEILVRWLDPEKGLIPPSEFIWVLEESGLISELGLWVAEETCRILLELPHEMFVSLNLSFNVSPRQLWGSDFVHRFLDILRKYRLCPTRIKIEITESVFVEKTEEIIRELEKISRVGVKVVLDDFGTGYSSLHYLSRLPVHDLKIDKTFVMGLPESKHNLEIVKAIVALARALGKRVVAEGVETVEQLKCLQQLEVDEVQGFLFSPPVPWNDFKKWLSGFPEEWKHYLDMPSACFRNVQEKCKLS